MASELPTSEGQLAGESSSLENETNATATNMSNIETSLNESVVRSDGEKGATASSGRMPRVEIQLTPAEHDPDGDENTPPKKKPQHKNNTDVIPKVERPSSPLECLVNAGVEILSQSFSRDEENDCPGLRLDLLPTDDDDDEQQQPNDGDAEDDNSVSSTPYFAPADFNPRNWIESMDAPTFGFALVALAVILTHPILSLTGALAVGVGYDLARFVCLATESANVDDTAETLPADSRIRPETETNATPAAATSKPEPVDDPSTTDDSSTIGCDDDDYAMKHHQLPFESTLLTVDDQLPDDWVDRCYPKLDHQVVSNVEIIGLNALEFFRVFFDDTAPYCFLEFQKKRGDTDISYEQWQDLDRNGLMSLHPDAKFSYPHDLDCILFRGRTLRFKAKTNSVFGPPFANTTKVQRFLIISKRLAVLESRTFLAGIPYADRFTVVEKWIMTAEKSDGRYTTKISSSCQAVFEKPCAFESQIRRQACSTVTDVCTAWCAMATDALKLTEKSKQDRLRQKRATRAPKGRTNASSSTANSGNKHSEGIEIRHSSTRRLSYVVGEEDKQESHFQMMPRSKSEADLPRIAQARQRSLSLALINRRREKRKAEANELQ